MLTPIIAVATVEPIWRTRFTVAVMVPVCCTGTAPCTSATIRFMNAPVPTPTTAMITMGTQSGWPTGSKAMADSPAAPNAVPRIGNIQYPPVRLAHQPVNRLLHSIPKTVAIGTSPETVMLVW